MKIRTGFTWKSGGYHEKGLLRSLNMLKHYVRSMIMIVTYDSYDCVFQVFRWGKRSQPSESIHRDLSKSNFINNLNLDKK